MEDPSYQPMKTVPPLSPLPSSYSYSPVKEGMKWAIVIVMIINIAFIQSQLAPSRQKLSDLTFAVENCEKGNTDPLARFFVDEFAERVKENPVSLPMFAYQFSKEKFRNFDTSDIIGNDNPFDFIGLFPLNIFETADTIIKSNFTPVMKTAQSFTFELAQGISLVTGDGAYYPNPSSWLLPMSYTLGIIADQVKPLSPLPVPVDSSVIGNFFTTFPYVLEDSLGNSKQIEMTAQDCEILMARFYATTWYTHYEKQYCDGRQIEKRVGTGNIQAFHDIQIGCKALYTGIDDGN